MTDYLRTISLHVDETASDSFQWVLLENPGDASGWLEHSASQCRYARWLDALEAGVVALRKLAADAALGPRTSDVDEDADAVG